MARFNTRPCIIEAVQFVDMNEDEIQRFTGRENFFVLDEEDRGDDPECIASVYDRLHSTWVGVKDGQWIIKGTKGEFYPCDPEVFAAKYEQIAEPVRRTPEPVREVASPNPHPSSAEAIVRGAEQVWGELAGHGGIITSNLPQRNPEVET